jgi:hypothetical protein
MSLSVLNLNRKNSKIAEQERPVNKPIQIPVALKGV